MPVSIEEFMLQDKSVLIETKEIKFKQFNFPFVLQSLTATKLQNLKKSATRPVKQNGVTVSKLNEDIFNDLMVVETIIEPNLHDADLQGFYGTVGKPADTLRAMLTAGQWGDLAVEVNKVSGFDEDSTVDELVEEAKN